MHLLSVIPRQKRHATAYNLQLQDKDTCKQAYRVFDALYAKRFGQHSTGKKSSTGSHKAQNTGLDRHHALCRRQCW